MKRLPRRWPLRPQHSAGDGLSVGLLPPCSDSALAGLSFVHFREVPPAPAGVMRFQIPIKAGLSFALSPDGRQLAFSAPGADGLPKLWVRALDSLTPRELPVSDLTNADTPFFWSPDSRYLTYDGGSLGK